MARFSSSYMLYLLKSTLSLFYYARESISVRRHTVLTYAWRSRSRKFLVDIMAWLKCYLSIKHPFNNYKIWLFTLEDVRVGS